MLSEHFNVNSSSNFVAMCITRLEPGYFVNLFRYRHNTNYVFAFKLLYGRDHGCIYISKWFTLEQLVVSFIWIFVYPPGGPLRVFLDVPNPRSGLLTALA